MPDASELARLADELGCPVDATAANDLAAYLEAMLEENRRVNLTAVRDPDEALILHALDGLAFGLADVDPSRTLDLGTGNGFPGVAIACARRDAEVTLLDRTNRKLTAIGRALEAAGWNTGRVRTLHCDASQAHAKGLAEAFTLVTARAVAEPAAVAKLAAPLLPTGGRLLLWLAEDTEAPSRFGATFDRQAVHEYALPEPVARHRKLADYRKR